MLEPAGATPAMPLTQPVAYGSAAAAWSDYPRGLSDLLDRFRPRRVCELGGGANPAMSLEEIAARGLEYTLLDISAEELAKAPTGYATLQADICEPRLDIASRFDFVFSRMLLEHVPDGRQFHRNVLEMLEPGGVAFHFFPTLYCPPFLANRLLKPAWTARLLNAFAPRDPVRAKKFVAYYSWCLGPTAGQIRRLERLGYAVLDYRGFFGHNFYARVPAVRRLHGALANFLVRHPSPLLTSYAYLLLRNGAAA
jgi:SAM-dependent methyltransferase